MSGAVSKSLSVLEALCTAGGPVRLTDLADRLGLQRSTAHRVLADLVAAGFVEQEDRSGRYLPTLRIWELGSAVVADNPIRQVAAGALRELHERLGETVSLIVRSGDDALYLDKLISPRPTRYTTRVGSRVPLPMPAGGKAILAFADDGPEVVARVAARIDLEWPIEEDMILRSLERARASGYAMSSARPGVRSFGAPILDRDRKPVGALAVSAPTDRLPESGYEAVAAEVVSTATLLSESLGRL